MSNEIEIRNRWAEFGLHFASKKLALVDKSTLIITNYPMPTDVAQVDPVLKDLSQALNALISERKETTAKLYDVIDKMMQPEKKVEAHLELVKDAAIKIKKAAQADIEAKNKLAKMEADTKAKINTLIINFINNAVDRCNKSALALYKSCLESGVNTSQEVISKIDTTYFELPEMNFGEYQNLYVLPEAQKENLVTYYKDTINNMFHEFETALIDRAEALAQAEQATKNAEVEATLEANERVQEIAYTATLQAEPIVINTKALKQSYTLAVNEDNHTAIALAYASNYELLKKYVTVKKHYSMTIGQMANYICKAKNDGIDITLPGLNFGVEEKL